MLEGGWCHGEKKMEQVINVTGNNRGWISVLNLGGQIF